MVLDTPTVATWTSAGRDDHAADVHFDPATGRVQVAAPDAELTFVALRWALPIPERARILGDHWERGYGDLEWRGMVPERPLPWYALIYAPGSGETLGLGVETGAASLGSWRIDRGGATLVLDLRCGGAGVRLGQRVLTAATIRALASDDHESPFGFAQRFCRMLCPAPRLPHRPVYGGNDWYFRYGDITQETVVADAARVRELSPSRDNAPFWVIDAGWFPGKGCNGGPYEVGNDDFPDLPGLAQRIAALEVDPGIWVRPLLTQAAVPASWRLPESHPHGRAAESYMDPSVPEVLDLVRRDIARLRGWGYRLIKHDFTTFDLTGRWGFQMGDSVTRDGWRFADPGRTTAEIVLALYDAIREAAGDALLIGCNTVGHLGAGRFELQRTGDDTSGRHWERTRKMGVNTLAFRMPQHGALFAVDADCVGLTGAIPWEKNRQWLDALARSGTPLFVSADPDALGPAQSAALTDAFALAATEQPPAEPLDWLETTAPRRWRQGDATTVYDWDDFPGSARPCPG